MSSQLGRPTLKRQITIYDAWVTRAYNLAPGEQLFIPCDDKEEQKEIVKIVKDALQRGPLDLGMGIRVSPTFRDKKLWVQIVKKLADRSIGFRKYKRMDGTYQIVREELNTTSDRLRAIQVAVEDGYDLERLEFELGTKLSQIEKDMFFPEETLPYEAYEHSEDRTNDKS